MSVYFHNWWPGFFSRTDANNITFFKKLMLHTTTLHTCVDNIEQADVLLEAGKPNDNIIKNWTFKINFIGEPVLPDHEKYDLVLTSINTINNVVDLPVSVMYILGNDMFSRLHNRKLANIIPTEFCCFIVSNSKCEARNKMFRLLNQYKKVNSGGSYCNNIGGKLAGTWSSDNHLKFIARHKFMICFENTAMETYSTEKIVNAYLAGVIPIYWSSGHITNIFNPESMLFLNDLSDDSYNELLAKIIELDQNDDKYLEFVNRPVFNAHNLKYWNMHYTFTALAQKIDNVLLKS